MKRQLDLFKAEVITFPCDRRWREVQTAARFLNLFHGPEADTWWKKRVQRLASPLRKAGVPEAEIGEQVLAFQEAVQIALQDLAQREMRA